MSATPLKRLKQWATALKTNVIALWLAARDPRTPWVARIIAGATAAYALSPIDLIPDFIPVVGLLDDLLIVPAGIWLALRMVPPAVMAECRARAAEMTRPVSRTAGAIFIAIWIGAAIAAWAALANG